MDTSSLNCGFPLWKIIILAVVSTIVIVVAMIVVNSKWSCIKYHYYARFSNDDDSQDMSLMKYDAFVSYR